VDRLLVFPQKGKWDYIRALENHDPATGKKITVALGHWRIF
jgi:hypothetical protein